MNLKALNNPVVIIVVAALALGFLSALVSLEVQNVLHPDPSTNDLIKGIVNTVIGSISIFIGMLTGQHITLNAQSNPPANSTGGNGNGQSTTASK